MRPASFQNRNWKKSVLSPANVISRKGTGTVLKDMQSFLDQMLSEQPGFKKPESDRIYMQKTGEQHKVNICSFHLG